MKFLDELLNAMLMVFLILFAIYFSGFLVFLAGVTEEDGDMIFGGVVLASLNMVLIWTTISLIGL